MAEVLGIAAAAIGLANTGLTLARFLKSYSDSVRTVDNQMAPVASQVQITSTTLENLVSLFKDDKFQGIYSEKVLEDTKDAINGCREAFNGLQRFVSSLMKLDASGKAHFSTATMFTFYFREKELDTWQARLERFKTSLVLILEVLNLRLLMKAAKDSSLIEDQRRDISRLLAEETEPRKREFLTDGQLQEILQQSNEAKRMPTVGSSSNAAVATPHTTQGANCVSSNPQESNHLSPEELSAGTHDSDQNVRKNPTSRLAGADHAQSLTARDQELFEALRQCADSAGDLSAHVRLNMSLWQQMQEAKHCGLVPSLSAIKQFFPAINLLPQKLDIYDQHFEWTRSIVEGDRRPKFQMGLAAKPNSSFLGHEGRFVHDAHSVVEENLQLSGVNEVPQPKEGQGEGASSVMTTFDVDELLRRWTILQA